MATLFLFLKFTNPLMVSQQQQHGTFHLLCSLLFLLFSPSQVGVHAALVRALARDGLVSGPAGYPGTVYQAIRYEPLCGTLGDYTTGYVAYGRCDRIVMDIYSNNTDTFAIYDESGVRLAGVIIGGGLDLCMCFSLRTTSGSSASDMCWWMSGDGMQDVLTGVISVPVVAGLYRSGSGKSLDHCGDIDLASAQAAWSATAVTHTVSERTRTLGGVVTSTLAVIRTSTVTPSSKVLSHL